MSSIKQRIGTSCQKNRNCRSGGWGSLLLCLVVLISICLSMSGLETVMASPATPAGYSLTVKVKNAPAKTKGRLYQVATFNPQDRTFTVTASFQTVAGLQDLIQRAPKLGSDQATIQAYQKELSQMGETLSAQVTANRIPAYRQVESGTDAQLGATLFFPNIDSALYLLVIDAYTAGETRYQPQVSLITVPSEDPETPGVYTNHLVIDAKVKEESKPTGETEITVIKLWETETGSVMNTMDRLGGEKSTLSRMEVVYPDHIVAVLYQDGKAKEKVTLSARNHWQYTFTNLAKGHTYQVMEESVPKGYSLTIWSGQDKVILHNRRRPTEPTKPTEPKPKDKELPFTAVLWWPVYILVMVGLISLCLAALRRRKDQ